MLLRQGEVLPELLRDLHVAYVTFNLWFSFLQVAVVLHFLLTAQRLRRLPVPLLPSPPPAATVPGPAVPFSVQVVELVRGGFTGVQLTVARRAMSREQRLAEGLSVCLVPAHGLLVVPPVPTVRRAGHPGSLLCGLEAGTEVHNTYALGLVNTGIDGRWHSDHKRRCFANLCYLSNRATHRFTCASRQY